MISNLMKDIFWLIVAITVSFWALFTPPKRRK